MNQKSRHYLVFGGSFDPIHHGHLFIAELAAQHIVADGVIFLPTRRAPHRAPLTASVDDRLAMLQMAIGSNSRFSFDTTDLDEEASGFTIDVLPRLQQQYPDAQLSFLVGEDALTRSHWHRFSDVVTLVQRFLVAPRDTTDDIIPSQALSNLLAALPKETRQKIDILASPRITISATSIRERVAAGATIRYLLPEAVHAYIQERRLYVQQH